MNDIEKIQKLIDESDNIVFFGGAGVSTESGIKDFRSKDGLYNMKFEYPAEIMLSSDMFFMKPDKFYEFYKMNMNPLDYEPNITHKYLTKLEENGKLKAIITQNIDGLHQKAGSKNVLEVHGTTYTNHCLNCNKEFSAEYVFNSEGVPKCDECGGVIKPDVVLYGEMLPECFITARKYISKADVLIVAGTSLTVEPAASLVRLYNGDKLVIINKDKTPYDNYANIVINDSLANVFSNLHIK